MKGLEVIKNQLNEILKEASQVQPDGNLIFDYAKQCFIEVNKIDSKDSCDEVIDKDMENLKVIKVNSEYIQFERDVELYSNHDSDCCESHELSFNDLTIEDFEGLSFDLTKDEFFKRIPDYGIELIPIKGHSVKIPGYGSNNGYYSDQLDLILTDGKDFTKNFDITDCQVVDG